MSTLEPHGTGFLVIDGSQESESEIKEVAAGLCPRCETPAEPWEPLPLNEPRFKARLATIQRVHEVEDVTKQQEIFLRENGGFVHDCSKCGLSYFVPASVAKVKA